MKRYSSAVSDSIAKFTFMTRPVWRNSFNTALEAEAAVLNNDGQVFELEAWFHRQRDLASRTSRLLRETGTWQGARPSTLPLVLAGRSSKLVVDLGGGSGWVYPLLQHLGLTPARYVVLELPEVASYFQAHPISGVEYKSIESSDFSLNPPIDLLYCNSSLQYMSDNTPLLRQIQDLNPNILLIDELLWTLGSEDWFTIQQNSLRKTVARFVSLTKIVSEVSSLGLKLIWSGYFGAGHTGYEFPKMSNFEPELRIDHAKTLLFVRKS